MEGWRRMPSQREVMKFEKTVTVDVAKNVGTLEKRSK